MTLDLRGWRLATASSDSTICLWDLQNNCEPISTLTGHTQEVSKVRNLVVCSTNSQSLVTGFDVGRP